MNAFNLLLLSVEIVKWLCIISMHIKYNKLSLNELLINIIYIFELLLDNIRILKICSVAKT